MHILYQVDPIDSRISYHLCHLCNKKIRLQHMDFKNWFTWASWQLNTCKSSVGDSQASRYPLRILCGPFMGGEIASNGCNIVYFWCAWKCTFRFPYGVVCFMPFSYAKLGTYGNLLVYPEAVLRSRPLSKYMAAVFWLLMLLSLNVAFTSRLNRATASGNWNIDFV